MKCEPIVREMRAELIRQLKLLTKEELKLVLFWLMVDVATILGILFALFVFYQPLLTDLYNCDIRDPFNLQEGWLLWAIIGVIFANTATFGTTFATKYFSKRLSQPKTKYSIDTGHGEQDRLTGSPKRRILMWSVMVALLLLQVVEEYVYRGYLMALLTKWLVTTIVVVICSFIIAFVHWKLEQVSHLFTGGDHSVEGSCSCSRLRRSAIGLAGIRIMEMNLDHAKFSEKGKRVITNVAIQAEITWRLLLIQIWKIIKKEDSMPLPHMKELAEFES
ncbi:uncharacterized protein LOC141653057 isoform X2 [Silene latifolia]|uniref:uncharacterized protein LOC141653057 isoform X2 n=1 Tax=Silene latifolia TaxID=37657 RepID=UPI003D7719F6